MSRMDFTTTLNPKASRTENPQSLYEIESPASDANDDDVYPFADETTPFAPDAAADGLVSNAITEHDHDPAANTATGSLNHFTAEQTAAHKYFVNKLLSAIGPTIQESLQQCMKVCVAASAQAAQAVIDAQKSPVQSSVSAPDDNNSAVFYITPPHSLDDYNSTSVYDSDHEPTQSATPSYTSVMSPPASRLSSSQLRSPAWPEGEPKTNFVMRKRQPRGAPWHNLQRTFLSRRTRRHDMLLQKLPENSPGTLLERLGGSRD